MSFMFWEDDEIPARVSVTVAEEPVAPEPVKTNTDHAVDALTTIKASKVPIVQASELRGDSTLLLKELGFSSVTGEIEKIARVRAQENMAAMSGYTRITREVYDRVNNDLQKKTYKYSGGHYSSFGGSVSYLCLKLEEVSAYQGIPPTDVLKEMKKAKDSGIFDTFSIISVKSVEHIPDPILVGQINGTDDLFFIAEWGEDIALNDFIG